jgi:hypothetical protein
MVNPTLADAAALPFSQRVACAFATTFGLAPHVHTQVMSTTTSIPLGGITALV